MDVNPLIASRESDSILAGAYLIDQSLQQNSNPYSKARLHSKGLKRRPQMLNITLDNTNNKENNNGNDAFSNYTMGNIDKSSGA